VNFGVFALYNDPCLVESLQAGLRLITMSPVPEMISFPKLSKTLFAFIHTLCTGQLPLRVLTVFSLIPNRFRHPCPALTRPLTVHTRLTLSLDSACFAFILAAIQEGLAGPSGQFKRAAWDTGVSTDCANALDGLLSWRLRASARDAGV
jgi:hypothetical protein